MSFFGIHVCMDEIQAFVLSLPLVGFCWICLKNWFQGRKDSHPHDKSR